MENVVRLAIQKSGRLNIESLELLKSIGIRIENGDVLKVRSTDFPIEVLFLRNSDIPRYIEDGVADIGIIGENTLYEAQPRVQTILPLGFSTCRLSLAVPKETNYPGFEYWQDKRIATSYPNSLKRFMESKGVVCDIHEISGSVEVAPGIGLAEGICDIVSSGNTLFVNGLKEVETVLTSQAVMIATEILSAEKKALIEQLTFRIKSVLRSRDYKYVLLNCPSEKVEDIARILPGMKSPTVLPLAQEGWSSVHSVIKESEFWPVIEALKSNGAEGMLIVPIQKMVL